MLHVLSMLLSSLARLLGVALPFSDDSSRIVASSRVKFERDGRGRNALDAWRTRMSAPDAKDCALLDVRRMPPMASSSHAICDRRVPTNETRRSLVSALDGRLSRTLAAFSSVLLSPVLLSAVHRWGTTVMGARSARPVARGVAATTCAATSVRGVSATTAGVFLPRLPVRIEMVRAMAPAGRSEIVRAMGSSHFCIESTFASSSDSRLCK